MAENIQFGTTYALILILMLPLLRLTLHPRNWAPAFGLGLLWLVNLLPYALKIRLGLAFGGLLFHLLRSRRRIAAINLSLCFPTQPKAQRDKILRQAFRHLGAGFIETAMSWWTPAARVRALTQVEGLEHLHAAAEKNVGLVMLGAHFSCLDIGAKMINAHQSFHVVQRRQSNPLFNYVMQKGRASATQSVIDSRDVRKIIGTVRKREAIWLAPDHDMGGRSAVFVPFFAHTAATITAPAKILRMTGAPAVFCATHRLADNSGYRLRVIPVPAEITTLDDAAAASAINQLVADAIRLDPAQYYWFHRRFKTQPGMDKGALYKAC